MRQKANRKKRPSETPETLLEQIEHYGTKVDDIGRETKRMRPSMESITNRILGKTRADPPPKPYLWTYRAAASVSVIVAPS